MYIKSYLLIYIKNLMELQKRYRIFFICSHLEEPNDIKYELENNNYSFKLSEKLSTVKILEDKSKCHVKVFSISFNEPKNENEVKINLKTNGSVYSSGIIKFKPNKNNFIYNFSFNLFHHNKKGINSPKILNLSFSDKLFLFEQMLQNKYKKNNNELINSLIDDSFDILKNEKSYDIDFYLSLLNFLSKSPKLIELLSYFNLEKINLPEKIDTTKINQCLNEIRNSLELIIKYLDEDENHKEKYKENLYLSLLYYMQKYQSDKVDELLEDKNGKKYYQKKLLNLQKYFESICLKNSFIDEIMHNNITLDYETIIIILNYLKSFERILIFINNNSNMLCQILKYNKNKKEEENEEEEELEEVVEEVEEEEEENNIEEGKIKKIDIFEILEKNKMIQFNDNFDKINEELNALFVTDELFKYIELGNNFWEKYSELFKSNLNILVNIKNILKNIKDKKTDLIQDLDFIDKIIHESGIEISKAHKFKNNIELLKFIKEEDIYYNSEENDEYKSNRDVNIFEGLNFSMKSEEEKEFFEYWKSINFYEMFEDNYDNYQKIIISKIDDISQFHLIFDLFDNFKNENISEQILSKIREKYNTLILANNDAKLNINKNEKFISDSANLIYLLESKGKGKSFLEDDLLNKLPIDTKIISEIFLNFYQNFHQNLRKYLRKL